MIGHLAYVKKVYVLSMLLVVELSMKKHSFELLKVVNVVELL